jgi:hypothetical protein
MIGIEARGKNRNNVGAAKLTKHKHSRILE